MKYIATTATFKLLKLNKRIRGIAGGTSASKTISIILILIDYAQTHKGELISIVSETIPHLKRGAIRDFLSIMDSHGYYKEDNWNKTDYIYTFPNGSKIEFFSAENSAKVRGPRRDVLFINEANNISFETYTQLEIRTKKLIWLDWNPTNEFWFYTELKNKDNVDFVILTYKDNEALEQSIIDSIESKKENKRWWKVYGEGQLGESDNKIYSDWQIIDNIPHEARLECYGLDFGYTNDPTAIVAVYYYNGGYILDEICYQRGLKNNQIADIFKNILTAPIYADSAEPKSIDEIKEHGLLVIPADKGKDSVLFGIQWVQSLRISMTKNSINLIKEYRNYYWKEDRDGRIVNEPAGGIDHCMDSARYSLVSRKPSLEYIDPNKDRVSVHSW